MTTPTDHSLADARGERRLLQLDGLRAIAVLAVVVEHGFGVINGRMWKLFSFAAPGPDGVRLFFVLSGFLITGLLLRARAHAESGAEGRRRVWTSFYVRRALRIFPLAYVAIALAWAVGIPAARHLGWYATYTSNVLVAAINFRQPQLGLTAFDTGLGHFWSLAVEEQFYLVWPVLILMCPMRRLGPVMWATFLAAGIFRALILLRVPLAAYTLLIARADALALGGIMALALYRGVRAQSVRFWVGWSAVSFTIVAIVLISSGWLRSWVTFSEWALILASGWLVVSASHGFKGAVGRALSSPPMVYLGTISYGIYVWHYLLPDLINSAAARVGVDVQWPADPGWSHFALSTTAAIAMASLSWWAFESPLNNLKRFVPYARKSTVLSSPATVPTLAAASGVELSGT